MNMTSWWSEEGGFFGPDYLKEYEASLPLERTLKEVAFIEEVLGLEPGMKILDVPCGHGRHSVELAKRGYNVTGYDINNFFLGCAREASENAGTIVRLQQGDMRDLPFEAEFDVALNLFTAMGYFDDDADDAAFLRRVFRALKPGGKFLLDFMHRDWLLLNFKSKDWHEYSDGSLMLVERTHDATLRRVSDRKIRVKDGVRYDLGGSGLRVYSPSELIALGEGVGFVHIHTYGDFSVDEELTLGCRRVVLQFQKK